MKVKVKVIKDAFYNLEYLKAGRIIEFKGKKLPSWATLADGIETTQGDKDDDKNVNPDVPCIDEKDVQTENSSDNVGQTEQPAEPKEDEAQEPAENTEKEETAEELDNVGQEEQEENAPISETQKAEYLDELINEGIEKGILIDDADKKSVEEQIAELEKALNK